MKLGTITNAASGTYPAVGTYKVKLKSIEKQESQFNPDGQFKWTATIVDVLLPGADDCEDFIDTDLFAYSNVLSHGYGPKSKTRQWMEAFLGHELEEGEDVDDGDLVGKIAQAKVKANGETDDGTQKTKVESIDKFVRPKKRTAEPEPEDEDF